MKSLNLLYMVFAVTAHDSPLQFKVTRDLRRSISVETFTPRSPPVPVPRRPTLPTISAGNSQSPREGRIRYSFPTSTHVALA